MKLEELQGIPAAWLDFLNSKMPLLLLPASIGAVAANAPAVRTRAANRDLITYLSAQPESSHITEKIRQLERPDSVVVVAKIHACLFGGPAAQILKCLTAIRVCEDLRKASINAIPVCWISDTPPDFPKWSITLIDAESELRQLNVSPAEVVPDSVPGAISLLSQFGGGGFDAETLELLGTTFSPGKSLSAATAGLMSFLMGDLGIIVLDAGAPGIQPVFSGVLARHDIANAPCHLLIGLILPVLAFVVDPLEVHSVGEAMPAFDGAGLPRPSPWPQACATIGDVKSRRTFERYHLDLAHLFFGEEEVLRRIKDALPRAGLAKLGGIKPEVEKRAADLKTFFAGETRFAKRADACKGKIIYQLEKLQDHFEASLEMRERIARRKIHKLCSLLAPNSRLQQSALAGIQVPLSYSRAGLLSLYDKLDILNFEHQLIWMD